jgi:AraC-like DNA-binding protein
MRMNIDWRKLPIVQEPMFSQEAMLSAQQPFLIGNYIVSGEHPDFPHYHEAYEIGYIVNGQGFSVVEGREYSFVPGQVNVRNGFYYHMDYPDDEATIFNVHFHPGLLHAQGFHTIDYLTQQPFSHRFPSILPATHPQTQEVVKLLKVISQEHQAKLAGWQISIHGLLLQSVGLLLRHFSVPLEKDETITRRQALAARLEPALRMIEERLLEPPSLKELAARVNLNPSYFGKLFAEAFGSSPVTYRNARRITTACRHLSDSHDSIEKIAEEAGFATVRQFNRLFKTLVGCTPSEYRLRYEAGTRA